MIRFTVFLSVLFVLIAQSAIAAEKGWRAGVAKVNITPELPIWLSGYGSRNKPAANKHDDLWAKALVIEDSAGHRAVLVTIDLVGIPRELSQIVSQQMEERYKLPRAAIALCASHTHSGPVVRGNLMAMYALDEDQSRRVSEYKTKLVESLAQVVSDAIDSIQPAKISWGIGEAGFAVNRRNNVEGNVVKLRQDFRLVGPVDHELPVLAVHGADGKLRAIVAGYACHATVLDGYAISADWPGAGQDELERRHPDTIALFVAGCGGDQNPLPRRSFDYVNKYGSEFADGVDAAQSSLEQIAPSLKVVYDEIDLPYDTLPTRAELELEAAKGERSQAAWAKFLLGEWDRDGKLPASYPYPIQAWKLGSDLTWLFLGGEVVVDYSLRLKAELGPGKTWVASYSNDVMGYIPSRRVLGEGGYEGGLARYPYGLPAAWGNKVEELIVTRAHELAAEAAREKQ